LRQCSQSPTIGRHKDRREDITDTALGKIRHIKFLVIDGSVLWTGSTNFTDTGLTLNANSSLAITGTVLASN
jgi:phosphatidylserine/phosphatidylglycerophosphate/cardiolipin synthase-like enzyme